MLLTQLYDLSNPVNRESIEISSESIQVSRESVEVRRESEEVSITLKESADCLRGQIRGHVNVLPTAHEMHSPTMKNTKLKLSRNLFGPPRSNLGL